MSEFLLELSVSPRDSAAIAVGGERLRRAARELTREGIRVRVLRWIFAPHEDTCFVLSEADSADAAGAAARPRRTAVRARHRRPMSATASAQNPLWDAHLARLRRYLRSIFVPDDETFLLYEAVSADAVREVARRAALPFDHIAATVAQPNEQATNRREP